MFLLRCFFVSKFFYKVVKSLMLKFLKIIFYLRKGFMLKVLGIKIYF